MATKSSSSSLQKARVHSLALCFDCHSDPERKPSAARPVNLVLNVSVDPGSLSPGSYVMYFECCVIVSPCWCVCEHPVSFSAAEFVFCPFWAMQGLEISPPVPSTSIYSRLVHPLVTYCFRSRNQSPTLSAPCPHRFFPG